jgi:hypothetical protein
MSGASFVHRGLGQLRQAVKLRHAAWAEFGVPADVLRLLPHDAALTDFLVGLGDTLSADRAYAALAAQPDSLLDAEWMGRYAALRRRKGDMPRWIARLEAHVQRARIAGDSIKLRTSAQDLRIVRAHVDELNGAAGAVLRAMREGMVAYPGGGWNPWVQNAPMLRLDLARRLINNAEFTEAQRYLNGFGIAHYWYPLPAGLVELYRGQVAEGLGDAEVAKLHFDRVTRWWRDCDPELVPIREQARAALARLSAEPPERT